MISLNNDPCSICGDTRSLLVQEAEYPEHRYPGAFCLRKCNGCGLLFNSPRLDDAELSDLYGQNYYFFQRPDAPELNRIPAMYARTVALVQEEFKGDDRQVLDVGSGRGYFPAVLKRLGWDAHGVEISREAADYARTRFGLDRIFTGTIEQYASDPHAHRFPLVTAIDVIEHVPHPDGFIGSLARVVRPGGLLIIDTPNAAAYNIRVEGRAWQGFNPFHIFLFNLTNLRQLLDKHGFKVEQGFSYNNLPADSGERPMKQKLRAMAIDAARSMGVIGPAARAYFKIKSMQRKKMEVEPVLASVVRRIQSSPSYLKTPDAEESLAREAIGDNIVAIARKT